jgi:protein ImuB
MTRVDPPRAATGPDRLPPRTLAVVCADWPVIAAGFAPDDPTPVAVLHANRVVATNAAARSAGVRVGLRRREAQGRCPEVLVVAHDPARDARRFEPVVAALATLTPWVEITEPGVCSCAARGPSRYFGGDAALAALVVRTVLAVDDSPDSPAPKSGGKGGAAQHPAPNLGEQEPGGVPDDRATTPTHPPIEVRVGVADGPLVARLAATQAPAEGTVVVPAGGSAAFLAPVPLRVLGPHAPDPDVLSTWLQLGLTTLGDVAALPTGAVLGRFGPDGAWVHRLARGLDPQGLRPEPVPPDVAETIDLDPPVERADAVAFAARTAAESLVERLSGRGLACTQVVVTLHTDHDEVHERLWRLDGPARPAGGTRPLAAAIADRARWQVDGWLSGPVRNRPTAGIARLVLAPGTVEPARGSQLGFWGGSAGAGEQVVRAVARLEALVGPEAVRVAEARGGRHPGTEVELVPTAAVDVSVARTVAMPDDPLPFWVRDDQAGWLDAHPKRDRDDDGELDAVDPGKTTSSGKTAGTGRAAKSGDAVEWPTWPGRLPAPSPSLVLDPPQLVEVLDDEGRPVEVDGRGEIHHPPASVCLSPASEPVGGARSVQRGRAEPTIRVVAWAGPWPVDERWWDPAERRRQARVQVVTEDGDALLLARHDRRWWLTAVHA